MSRLKDQYILFIGMGDWDVPQLDIARAHGFLTIVINRNKEALAITEADISFVIDGQDTYAIFGVLVEHGLVGKIKYVYTGTELFTSTALIANALAIPWHDPTVAYLCEKKHLMQSAFKKMGLNIANGFSANSVDEVLQKVTFDDQVYVIKPSDSLSSQGVSIISSVDELECAVENALSYSNVKKIICEQFIEGTLHDINGVLTDTGFVRLGINDKEAGPLPHAVVVSGRAPTILNIEEQQQLYCLFEETCRNLGLGPGPVKGDYILDRRGKFYVMEVAPRLHGPLGSLHLIPQALGINPFNELLNFVNNRCNKQHTVDATHNVILRCKAFPSLQEIPDDVLCILKKAGIDNQAGWRSNADIPIYAITKELTSVI